MILGDKEFENILFLARRYARHADYWLKVPLRTHLVRYEDLRSTPLPELMKVLTFLLPNEKLPPLERLACTVELHEKAQAYHSSKAEIFSSWNNFSPKLRKAILEELKPVWCRFGYDQLAREQGLDTEVDCSSLSNAGLLEQPWYTPTSSSRLAI